MAAQNGQATHDEQSNTLHAMAKQINRHFPQVPLINCTELKRNMDDSLLSSTICVVDVRDAAEVAVSMIPGSITSQEFERRKEEFKGKTVVCYCTVGYRSSGYASKLRQQGFDAKNLEGSIVRWTQKRYPLVVRGADGSEQPTKRVHVFGKQWALQPDDYEGVMFKRPFLSVIMNTLRKLLPGGGSGSGSGSKE